MMLQPSQLIAQGKTRAVYEHPDQPNLLLKIAFQPCWYQEAIREASEFFRIASLGLPLQGYLQTIHGMAPTSLGYALLVNKVADYDGWVSKPLRWYLENGLPERYRLSLRSEVDQLIQAFDASDAIFQDAHSRNVLLRLDSPQAFSLVVIDGFVGRNDWKEALRRHSSWMRHTKNQHSRNKLIKALSQFGVSSDESTYDFGRHSLANSSVQ